MALLDAHIPDDDADWPNGTPVFSCTTCANTV
jgi:hypothetical protein